MGYKEVDVTLSVSYPETELKNIIAKKLHISDFQVDILKKSLDARNKNKIHWTYRLGVTSPEIKSGSKPEEPSLHPVYKKRKQHILIAGSGPAGMISALFLAESGYRVTLIERGSKVEKRKIAVSNFEKTGILDPSNNYAFGEGGAGTFSDGKLTSRTKNISEERNYIYRKFVEAGAPPEIHYMTHPHLGTDNLYTITQELRNRLQNSGCEMIYDNLLEDFCIKGNKISEVITSKGTFSADIILVATGLSAFETYRMLIRRNIQFTTKNFAVGFRAEHPQELINKAQWGKTRLPGIHAAEYRLTFQSSTGTPVYTFCMCPGGIIVPATAYPGANIVNGMSYYNRDGYYGNAAVVAGLNLEKIFSRPVSASETLEWLGKLESTFHIKDYSAPANTIEGFIHARSSASLPSSSYPFPLIPSDFRELMPSALFGPLAEGLKNFSMKIRGYEKGIIAGLESKTSAPIQVARDPVKMNSYYENLYIAGEGSGWAGGIISSAADGLRICRKILMTANEF